MEIPVALTWWRGVPGGAQWLDRLPQLAAECAEIWQLRLGRAFDGGNVSLVLAVERADGLPAVLKINFPEEESEHEADALDFWQGVGAVWLLAHDRRRRRPPRRALRTWDDALGTPRRGGSESHRLRHAATPLATTASRPCVPSARKRGAPLG